MPRLYQRTLPIPPVLSPKGTTVDADGRKTHLYQIQQTSGLAKNVMRRATGHGRAG
jgi:spore coat protein A, manganese oxidase